MTEAHTHGPQELCPAGRKLYEQALREGRVSAEHIAAAPCLVDLGLLHPALDDLDWLEPVAPAVVLHRMLRASGHRIAEERRREELLAEAFAPLMRIDGRRPTTAESSAFNVLSGTERINRAITEAMAEAGRELLSVQPSTVKGRKAQSAQATSLSRDQALLDRGGRIRALYQHTQRHVPFIAARYEQLRGDAEARTLDEVTDRLIVVDREVAFIPRTPTARWRWKCATRPWSPTWPPPSTASGAWPPPCTPRPSGSPPSTASPPASAPSQASWWRATPTPS